MKFGVEFEFENGDAGRLDTRTAVGGGAFGAFAFRGGVVDMIAYHPGASARHTAARGLNSVIRHIGVFSSINQHEGITRSLMRIHMKLQNDYDRVRRKYVRLSDAGTISQMAELTPKNHVRIFLDRKCEMVPEFVKTSAGKMRNPAIDGPGVVIPIVSK